MEAITEMAREVATQKTPQQAAALIQARVRGAQQREKHRRLIDAVTKLQARQRARYTRREFQKLLEFYNEQESFLMESKLRQTRLWHRQLELYFLQHTTAEEMERIRQFQYERGARRIQREWRRSHPKLLEDVDVSGLGKPFDPFGLVGSGDDRPEAQDAMATELYGDLPEKVHAPPVDAEALTRRRAEIQERLQRKRKELEKSRGKAEMPTRRELYTTLVEMRQQTMSRLRDVGEKYRRLRPQRDLEAAQLLASLENRSNDLLDEDRAILMTKRPLPAQQVLKEREDFEKETAKWRHERKRAAWAHHTRVLDSVLGKDKWYDTSIAGETRDIRLVYSNSPWEHEKQVWQWPAPASPADQPPKPQNRVATALDRFMFGLPQDEEAPDNQAEEENGVALIPEPLSDVDASSWWRAHATQSHFSYKKLQQQRQRQRFSRVVDNNRSNHSEDAHVTPEMLVNPVFFKLYEEINAQVRRQEAQRDVKARMAQLEKKIHQKVVEIETKIEVNTRLIMEKKAYEQQQKLRITQEQRAATQIQRHVRGKLGRKKAKEHMAQYFVMVRGRAIRKGRCEECGEQPAVLECKECEESLHFCPVCWVQVHSTRRRKTHVPIPMVMNPHQSSAHQDRSQTKSKTSAKSVPTGVSQLEPVDGYRSTTANRTTALLPSADGASPAALTKISGVDSVREVPPATTRSIERIPQPEEASSQTLVINRSTTSETVPNDQEITIKPTDEPSVPTTDQPPQALATRPIDSTGDALVEAPKFALTVDAPEETKAKPTKTSMAKKATTTPKPKGEAKPSGRTSLRDRMASGKELAEKPGSAVAAGDALTSETVTPTPSEQHQLQTPAPSVSVEAKANELRQSQNVEIAATPIEVVEQKPAKKETNEDEALVVTCRE